MTPRRVQSASVMPNVTIPPVNRRVQAMFDRIAEVRCQRFMAGTIVMHVGTRPQR